MTTLGLELHGGHLRIIHFRDEKGNTYLFARLAPLLVTACPIGNPSQPHFQAAHAQVVNIFPRALGKKQEAGRAASRVKALSVKLSLAERVLTAAAGLKGELTRYKASGSQYNTPKDIPSSMLKDVIR